LFLSVGLLHLLPESANNFESHYDEIGEGDVEHFPFPYLILILSFSLILFIEKIAAPHSHSHGEDDHHVHD
jgi:zinc transporter 1/2/3